METEITRRIAEIVRAIGTCIRRRKRFRLESAQKAAGSSLKRSNMGHYSCGMSARVRPFLNHKETDSTERG